MAAQFIIVRFMSFAMAGMTIVVVPVYQAETAPKILMISRIQIVILFGSLVTWGAASMDSNAGWIISVALQFLAPIFLLVLWFWVPEIPQWPVSKGRVEEAMKALSQIRKNTSEQDT
ncbi:hypothetical protein ACHAPM_007351 [Fusarium culmorum]